MQASLRFPNAPINSYKGGDFEFILDRARDKPENNAPIMRQYYQRFLSIRSLNVPGSNTLFHSSDEY